MQPLLIAVGDSTPEVIMDRIQNKFSITGISLPENVFDFYDPIIDWIKIYCNDPNPGTELHVNMSYFNTASSKIILEIIALFDSLSQKGKKVEIVWYYLEMDDDMRSTGKEFESMLTVPFKYISYV